MEKDKISVFQKTFLLFIIGQVCFVLATISMAESLKILPRWLSGFSIFEVIGCVVFFIALLRTRFINQSLKLSFYTFCTFLIALIFCQVCKTSNDDFFLVLGKGLVWSVDMLFCITYLYFFHGCDRLFLEAKQIHEVKHLKASFIAYAVLYVTYIVFNYLSTASFVVSNMFLNRFFLYGSIAIMVGLRVFTLVALIILAVKMNKKQKKGEENGSRKEAKEITE